MIEVLNLKKSYGEKTIFDNITFKIQNYGLYYLKGANASGKTTLFNLISGNDFDFEGEIRVNNIKINEKNIDSIKNYLTYINQDFLLLENSTVLESLKMISRKKKNKYKEILNFVGLEQLINEKIYTLSSGEKRRLLIAYALLRNSQILLLDEIFNNLDSANIRIIAEILNKLKNNHIIILSTHYLPSDLAIDQTLEIISTQIHLSSILEANQSISYTSKNHANPVSHSILVLVNFCMLLCYLLGSIFIGIGGDQTQVNFINQRLYYDNVPVFSLIDNQTNNKFISKNKSDIDFLPQIQNLSHNSLKYGGSAYFFEQNCFEKIKVLYGSFPEGSDKYLISSYQAEQFVKDNTITNISKYYELDPNIVGVYESNFKLYSDSINKLFKENNVVLSTFLTSSFISIKNKENDTKFISTYFCNRYSFNEFKNLDVYNVQTTNILLSRIKNISEFQMSNLNNFIIGISLLTLGSLISLIFVPIIAQIQKYSIYIQRYYGYTKKYFLTYFLKLYLLPSLIFQFSFLLTYISNVISNNNINLLLIGNYSNIIFNPSIFCLLVLLSLLSTSIAFIILKSPLLSKNVELIKAIKS